MGALSGGLEEGPDCVACLLLRVGASAGEQFVGEHRAELIDEERLGRKAGLSSKHGSSEPEWFQLGGTKKRGDGGRGLPAGGGKPEDWMIGGSGESGEGRGGARSPLSRRC